MDGPEHHILIRLKRRDAGRDQSKLTADSLSWMMALSLDPTRAAVTDVLPAANASLMNVSKVASVTA